MTDDPTMPDHRETPLTVNGAYYSMVSGIVLPAVSVAGLFSFLGPDLPPTSIPALILLGSVAAGLAGLAFGLVAAIRLPRLRGVGIFGATLNAFYLAGMATFQLALLAATSGAAG
ncbi:MAG: hypothetical protein VYE73_15310 [Acidobacteriota bacterium]|nr:hypothetical protein [Acidobacteriota bacterium]